MSVKFNSTEFSADVRKRRNKVSNPQSLRDASIEIGISSATLCRIENGNLPDVITYGLICNWLDISPAQYYIKTETQK